MRRKPIRLVVLSSTIQTVLIVASGKLSSCNAAIFERVFALCFDICYHQPDETIAAQHVQIADLPMASAVSVLRNLNLRLKARKAMKKLVCVMALALLAACSNLPTSSQVGQVQHPDPFHSYID